MLEQVRIPIFALCMCVVGGGACSILRILTRYGDVHDQNIKLGNVRRIFPQFFRKMWNNKGKACFRAVFIAAMFGLGVKLFGGRMDMEAYILSFCAISIVTVLSYDARLTFTYGLISSIWALILFAGPLGLDRFPQNAVEKLFLPLDQALTVYMGCAIVCIVVFSFSIIFAIFHKGSLRHREEHQDVVVGEGNNVLEDFWGGVNPMVVLASIPISSIMSSAVVIFLRESYV